MTTAHLSAVDAVVLETRTDGSALVEIPILPAIDELDLGQTSGGGAKVSITVDDLQRMVGNFTAYNRPVPIGTQPHVDYGERAGPSPAFVEALEVRGSTLWARMWLSAWLYSDLASWRGFSVEMIHDMKTPTEQFRGWTLVGGVFTNRPAAGVHFKIAAEGDGHGVLRIRSSVELAALTAEVGTMADGNTDAATGKVQATQTDPMVMKLEAQLGEQTQMIDRLRSQNSDDQVALSRVNAKLATSEAALLETRGDLAREKASHNSTRGQVAELESKVSKLERDNRSLADKQSEIESAQLSASVREIVTGAIDGGVPPRVFDGHEADPAAWLRAKFTNLEAFKQFVTSLGDGRSVPASSPVASGSTPNVSRDKAIGATGPEGRINLSDEQKAQLKKLGVDPKYINVDNASNLPEKATA